MKLTEYTILGILLILSPCLNAQSSRWVIHGDDDGPGSLRAVISSANPGDTIRFADTVSCINLVSSEILIDRTLIIIGNASQTEVTRAAQLNFRILRVEGAFNPIVVRITNLIISNGLTAIPGNPEPGGGILISRTADSVFLANCVLRNNRVEHASESTYPGSEGGKGGGIYNQGYLYLRKTLLENNAAGVGGISTFFGGYGGNGGAIFNYGTLLVDSSSFVNNCAGSGGACWASTGSCSGGEGGHGGAIYNAGNLDVLHSIFERNKAGNGGSVSGGYHYTVWGGKGGSGGSIFNAGNGVLQSSQVIAGNSGLGMMGGSDWPGTTSGRAPGGDGGAIFNVNRFKIINSLICLNSTSLPMEQATPLNNAYGGGIYNQSADTLFILNSTIAANRVNAVSNFGSGGGLYVKSGPVRIMNSIVAANKLNTLPEDIHGSVQLDYSLVQASQHMNYTGSSNNIDLDPLFFKNDQDFRLLAQSPAINTGNPDTSLLAGITFDIGGRPRIVAGVPDKGAYEKQVVEPPVIFCSPDHINFPVTYVDDQSVDSIALYISSDHPVILDTVAANSIFEVSRNGNSGWHAIITQVILQPGLNRLYVRFAPEVNGFYSGILQVTTPDSIVGSTLIPISGEGTSCRYVSGSILQDTLWQGCVRLGGNITINNHVTLRVAPGTIVKAMGEFLITNYGSIHAMGTKSEPILLSSDIRNYEPDSTLTGWKGIHFLNYDDDPGTDTSYFRYCTISEVHKRLQEYTGAVLLSCSNHPGKTTFENCIFENNSAGIGTAICKNDGSQYELLIINTHFRNNHGFYGPALKVDFSEDRKTSIYNSIFQENTVDESWSRSAIEGKVNCFNTTFFRNYPSPVYFGYYWNCIFWPITPINALPSYYNTSYYPGFTDTIDVDLHLIPGAAARNMGCPDSSQFLHLPYDMDGRRRIADGVIDLGAFELQNTGSATVQFTPGHLEMYAELNKPVTCDTFLIRNTGGELLVIDSITLPDGFRFRDDLYNWQQTLGEIDLNTGCFKRLLIQFLPSENKLYTGNILVFSNDPLNPLTELQVTGHVSLPGIEESDTSLFSVYPVPSSGKVFLDTPFPITRVIVNDLHGKMAWKAEPVIATENVIDLSSLPKGIYLIEVYTKSAYFKKKILLH